MLINKYFGCNPGENIFYIYLMKYRRWSNGRTFSRFPHFPQWISILNLKSNYFKLFKFKHYSHLVLILLGHELAANLSLLFNDKWPICSDLLEMDSLSGEKRPIHHLKLKFTGWAEWQDYSQRFFLHSIIHQGLRKMRNRYRDYSLTGEVKWSGERSHRDLQHTQTEHFIESISILENSQRAGFYWHSILITKIIDSQLKWKLWRKNKWHSE